ncbi:MAG TPA: biotin--[acetyl-CoA-carboxylase] ligase [Xanthobacteraceae bacterium]|nr:biotin--[acetyl-CoA-carboxylase] ligase [Xanthobacteraceae bacterium]
MRLDPTVVAAGFRLAAHDVLGSTNTEALERARGGDKGPLWIVAREQTAGRGRRGREWVSAPGNLYATLLLFDPAPPETAPQLAFVAGLAVYDAIAERARDLAAGLALKWPNDVLYANRKLAGILIESEMSGGKLAVAVGIGVNCVRHPAQTSFPATNLDEAGQKVAPESLLYALSRSMMRCLDQWNRGAGFRAIRADWLGCAQGVGGEITVRLAGRDLAGRFEGLDEAGRLVLRHADGRLQTITAGEIFPVAERKQVVSFLQMPRQKGQGD